MIELSEEQYLEMKEKIQSRSHDVLACLKDIFPDKKFNMEERRYVRNQLKERFGQRIEYLLRIFTIKNKIKYSVDLLEEITEWTKELNMQPEESHEYNRINQELNKNKILLIKFERLLKISK